MVSRMVRGKLSQAWGRWRESHAELARQRRVLGRAMGRMSRGRESAAFNKWVEHVVEAVRQRDILRKVALFMGLGFSTAPYVPGMTTKVARAAGDRAHVGECSGPELAGAAVMAYQRQGMLT